MDVNCVHEDSLELADAFDDYAAENGLELKSQYAHDDWSLYDCSEEIEEEGLTTIAECVKHFCKQGLTSTRSDLIVLV